MRSRTAALATGATLAVVVLAGCRVDKDDISVTQNHKDVAYVVDQPVQTVKVTAIAGKIEVVGGDGTAVDVRERLSYDDDAPLTHHTVRGNALALDYTCPERPQTCWVSYRLEVPKGVTVDLRSDAGEVRISKLAGPVHAETAAGFVVGSKLTSDDVTVRSTAGSVTLEFDRAPATVDAHTTAGAVTVRLPREHQYAVDARTSAGSMRVSVPQDMSSAYHVKASSSAGSVSVLTS